MPRDPGPRCAEQVLAPQGAAPWGDEVLGDPVPGASPGGCSGKGDLGPGCTALACSLCSLPHSLRPWPIPLSLPGFRPRAPRLLTHDPRRPGCPRAAHDPRSHSVRRLALAGRLGQGVSTGRRHCCFRTSETGGPITQVAGLYMRGWACTSDVAASQSPHPCASALCGPSGLATPTQGPGRSWCWALMEGSSPLHPAPR